MKTIFLFFLDVFKWIFKVSHYSWDLNIYNQKIFLRQMAFLNFGIALRGKISQKLHLFCPEFRENPTDSPEDYSEVLPL